MKNFLQKEVYVNRKLAWHGIHIAESNGHTARFNMRFILPVLMSFCPILAFGDSCFLVMSYSVAGDTSIPGTMTYTFTTDSGNPIEIEVPASELQMQRKAMADVLMAAYRSKERVCQHSKQNIGGGAWWTYYSAGAKK